MPQILAKHSELKALVAFDFMKVSWSQLEWAWRYNEIYSRLIENEHNKVNKDAEEWYC